MENKLLLALGTFILLIMLFLWLYNTHLKPFISQEISEEKKKDKEISELAVSLVDRANALYEKAESEKAHRRKLLEKLRQWTVVVNQESEELKRENDSLQVALYKRSSARRKGYLTAKSIHSLQQASLQKSREALRSFFADAKNDEKFIKRLLGIKKKRVRKEKE